MTDTTTESEDVEQAELSHGTGGSANSFKCIRRPFSTIKVKHMLNLSLSSYPSSYTIQGK